MHCNILATSLRNSLNLVELLLNLSGWGIFQGSFFVWGGGAGSEISLRSRGISSWCCHCRLLEAVPKGAGDSFCFLFKELTASTVAIAISTTALSLAIQSWTSWSIDCLVQSWSLISSSLTWSNLSFAPSTIVVVCDFITLVRSSYCLVSAVEIFSIRV